MVISHAQFIEGRVPEKAAKIMKNGWKIGIIGSLSRACTEHSHVQMTLLN